MITDRQDHRDPISAPIPADPLASIEAVGEVMLEPWHFGLALGTAWWNASLGLWWPQPPVPHHHSETVPPPLADDAPSLFA